MKLDSAILYTNDISRAKEFYIDVIHLKLDYQSGDRYIQFKFENGVTLGIKKTSEEREFPGHQTIFVRSEDIEKDYKSMKEKGVKFRKELEEKEWGRQFSIFDPDMNKVEFVERK